MNRFQGIWLPGAAALVLAGGAWAPAQARIATPPAHSAPEASAEPAPAASDEGAEAVLSLLRSAVKLSDQKDYKGALAQVRRAIAMKSFADLPPEAQMATHVLDGAFSLEVGDAKGGHAAYVKATALEGADAEAWSGRVDAAFRAGDRTDGYKSLAILARRWPDQLKTFNNAWLGYKVFTVDRPDIDRAVQADLLGALFDAHWTQEGLEPSDAWLTYAVILAQTAQADRLGAVAARIDDAPALAAMHADRRFDAVIAGDPARFDVSKALERQTAQARITWAANPRKIERLTGLTYYLLTAKRYEEVLKLADAAIAKTSARGGAKAFEDAAERLSWLYDARSRALWGLGRWDEAVAAMAQGAAHHEGDEPKNVSQAINLADLYNALGRPKDALAAVDKMGLPSEFGRMQLEGVRYEALFALKDPQAAASLEYLKAHAADAFDTYLYSLVLTGDADVAARTLITALENPYQRLKVLLSVQDYARSPEPPARERIRAAYKALLARADVSAALTKVGRIEHYDLSPLW